ncbi:C2H2-like zinc finger protein [Striga asiatica]|uniref:C2H2-like zinc finger protein n=1 Tax=Striga asiatica TaxID=4170 RepID=A0A5A7QV43_STRAF|nr:C2H2-like zinc finger protein [Striga asiatica]
MAKSIRRNTRKQPKDKQQHKKPPHSWAAVKSLFTCKYLQVQPPQPHVQPSQPRKPEPKKQTKPKIKYCSASICNNTKVMQKPDPGPKLLTVTRPESNSPSISGPFRGMPFRKLSGCYECRFVADPSLRGSICSCPECGEIFMKAENLEIHQAVRHAVSELGPEDTSKNIVEIIFQSSWLKKQAPICKIDRILKVQNTPTTISKFEEYRDVIKAKATRQPKKHPRCLADGNELLRFHCTTLMCSLGLNGSSNLCGPSPSCGVCSVIKNGFKVTSDVSSRGILTTATSGKAHDSCRVGSDNDHGERAMLVCRVIAGRVKKNPDGNSEDYDSVSGSTGVYSNLDELYVFNPKAILPCFVVIYRGF